jgi:phosphodiesterase/alkaline phosphatase D-like protein
MIPNDELRRRFVSRPQRAVSGADRGLAILGARAGPGGRNPFTLGVASGDPAPDGALL